MTTKILNALGFTEEEVSVVFVSDKKIQEYNKDYRGLNKPTDILSFSMREGETVFPDTPLGDVVISVETAQRQAREMGASFDEEITRLLVHGLCHLAGYDHETKEDNKAMRAKERALMKRMAKEGLL